MFPSSGLDDDNLLRTFVFDTQLQPSGLSISLPGKTRIVLSSVCNPTETGRSTYNMSNCPIQILLVSLLAILGFLSPTSLALPAPQMSSKQPTPTSDLERSEGCWVFHLSAMDDPSKTTKYQIKLPYGSSDGYQDCALDFGTTLGTECTNMTFSGLSCLVVSAVDSFMASPSLKSLSLSPQANVQFYLAKSAADQLCISRAMQRVFGRSVACQEA